MKNSLITAFEKKHLKVKKTVPTFRPGDTVKVHYKIVEGIDKKTNKEKYRLQPFEGIVIRYRKGFDSTFTVRKIGANGIGVERVFPLCSPFVDKIEVKSSGVVKRARLYYLRNLSGKAARIRNRFSILDVTKQELTEQDVDTNIVLPEEMAETPSQDATNKQRPGSKEKDSE